VWALKVVNDSKLAVFICISGKQPKSNKIHQEHSKMALKGLNKDLELICRLENAMMIKGVV
jgi:hypothetical protein